MATAAERGRLCGGCPAGSRRRR
ncbi:hypothetical protein A2U01_0040467, partial [Trifolium medium]|nr:hypothetical protein [Trifolium medium]